MKKIILMFALILSLGLYTQCGVIAEDKTITNKGKITGKERRSLINNIIKANPYIGYKGDVLIKVYDYSVKGSAKNITEAYKAYIDLVDTNNEKLIFYKDKDLEELEINVVNKKLTVKYAGNDITDNIDEYKEEFLKYPYNFLRFWLYSEEVPRSLFEYINLNLTEYFDGIKDNLTTFKNEGDIVAVLLPYEAGMEIDNNFRIQHYYLASYLCNYKWEDDFISSMYTGGMAEDIKITFLNKDGWVRE